jgi:hypothetical protein
MKLFVKLCNVILNGLMKENPILFNLLSVAGSILMFGWKTYPNETAYFSGPEYAHNCQTRIENTLKFPKLSKYYLSIK